MVTKLVLLATTLLLHPLFASDEAKAKVTKVNLTESLRMETMTQGDDQQSETRSASKGKFSIAIELAGNFDDLSASTGVDLSVGNFRFKQPIGNDKNFTTGQKSASLRQFAEGTGVNRTVISTVKITWSKDHLTLKMDEETPRVRSIIAEDLGKEPIGDINAQTKVVGHIGSLSFEADVPVKGKIGRKIVEGGNISGSVTTVDVRGKL